MESTGAYFRDADFGHVNKAVCIINGLFRVVHPEDARSEWVFISVNIFLLTLIR